MTPLLSSFKMQSNNILSAHLECYALNEIYSLSKLNGGPQ